MLVTDAHPAATRRLALTRLLGTVLGAAAGATLALLDGPPLIMVALGAGGVFAAASALRQAEVGKLAAYVAGVVLLDYAERPAGYAIERVAETALGLAAALVFAQVAALFVRPEPR